MEPIFCKHVSRIKPNGLRNSLPHKHLYVCEDCHPVSSRRRKSKSKGESGEKEVELDRDILDHMGICLTCGHVSCHGLHCATHAYESDHPIVMDTEKGRVSCLQCDKRLPVAVAGKPEVSNKRIQACYEFVLLQKKNMRVAIPWIEGFMIRKLETENEARSAENRRRQEREMNLYVEEEVSRADFGPFGAGRHTNASSKQEPPITQRPREIEVVGFRNLGNTCFFNSVMQCLTNLSPVHERFQVNNIPEYGEGVLTQAFRAFLEDSVVCQNAALDPSDFFLECVRKSPRFRGYQQQDSHEFLRYFLDELKIEEESRRKKRAKLRALAESNHEPPEEPPSVVDSLFGSTMISGVVCEKCNSLSVVKEPFFDLSIPCTVSGSQKKPSKSERMQESIENQIQFAYKAWGKLFPRVSKASGEKGAGGGHGEVWDEDELEARYATEVLRLVYPQGSSGGVPSTVAETGVSSVPPTSTVSSSALLMPRDDEEELQHDRRRREAKKLREERMREKEKAVAKNLSSGNVEKVQKAERLVKGGSGEQDDKGQADSSGADNSVCSNEAVGDSSVGGASEICLSIEGVERQTSFSSESGAGMTSLFDAAHRSLDFELLMVDSGTVDDFSGRGLVCLPEFTRDFAEVTFLNLSRNRISVLPSDVSRLSCLRVLNVSDNEISSLPLEVGAWTKLQRLSIQNNELTSLSAGVANWTSIEEVYIGGNKVAALPPEVGAWQRLRSLDVHGNALSALPQEVRTWSSLQVLDLHRNKLSSLPVEVSAWRSLRKLDLNDNELNSLPPEVNAWVNLEVAYLCFNKIDDVPPEATAWSSLKMLFLREGKPLSFPLKLPLPESEGPSASVSFSGEVSSSKSTDGGGELALDTRPAGNEGRPPDSPILVISGETVAEDTPKKSSRRSKGSSKPITVVENEPEVKRLSSVQDSLKFFTQPELLEGANAYGCEECSRRKYGASWIPCQSESSSSKLNEECRAAAREIMDILLVHVSVELGEDPFSDDESYEEQIDDDPGVAIDYDEDGTDGVPIVMSEQGKKTGPFSVLLNDRARQKMEDRLRKKAVNRMIKEEAKEMNRRKKARKIAKRRKKRSSRQAKEERPAVKDPIVLTRAVKRVMMESAPPVLTLHLKRFIQTGRGTRKHNDHVSFPLLLDFSPFLSDFENRKRRKVCLYRLVGVVVHSGGMGGGHYVAYVCKDSAPTSELLSSFFDSKKKKKRKDEEEEVFSEKMMREFDGKVQDRGTWYYCSDTLVQRVHVSEVQKAQAYLLFYERL